jgi:membrane protein YqaA with SNARE-associated domain
LCYYAAVKTLGEIIRNRYLLGLAVFLGAVFGVSFLLPPAAQALTRFFAYMSLACNTIPLPATPVVLYMGTEYPWIVVALVGGAATSLANLIDYEIFSTVFKTKLLKKIKDSEHSQASIRTFNRVAFPALAAVNFVVFSWDLIRLVAIAAKYPRWKYALATFIGRTARYAVLAAVGEFFKPPLWAVGIVAVLVALPALVSWVRSRIRKPKESEKEVNRGPEG